jgi:hypothetical protein
MAVMLLKAMVVMVAMEEPVVLVQMVVPVATVASH